MKWLKNIANDCFKGDKNADLVRIAQILSLLRLRNFSSIPFTGLCCAPRGESRISVAGGKIPYTPQGKINKD